MALGVVVVVVGTMMCGGVGKAQAATAETQQIAQEVSERASDASGPGGEWEWGAAPRLDDADDDPPPSLA